MIVHADSVYSNRSLFWNLRLKYYLTHRPSISDMKVFFNKEKGKFELAVSHFTEGICIYPILEGGLLDDNGCYFIDLPTDFISLADDNHVLLSMWGTRVSRYKLVSSELESERFGGSSRNMPFHIGRLCTGNSPECTEYLYFTYASETDGFDCVKRVNYPGLNDDVKIGLGKMRRPWDVCVHHQLLLVTESEQLRDRAESWGLQLYHLPLRPLHFHNLKPFHTISVVSHDKWQVNDGPNYVAYSDRLRTIFTASQENSTIGVHRLMLGRVAAGEPLLTSQSSYMELLPEKSARGKPDGGDLMAFETRVKPGPMAWDSNSGVLFMAAQHADKPASERNCIYCYEPNFNAN